MTRAVSSLPCRRRPQASRFVFFSVSRKIQPNTDAIMMTKFAIFSQPSCGRNADRTLMASISAVAAMCRM